MKKLSEIKFDTKILAYSFLVLGLVLFFIGKDSAKEPTDTKSINLGAVDPNSVDPSSVDTFIPKGFVLIPVELTNSDSLASLVGEMGGVVDLYLASSDKNRTNLKVASKVKLLRAPLNPQQFAVLIKETLSSRLVGLNGPFQAVVQNPSSQNTENLESKKPSMRIEYQN